jgi:hypothetical protein
MPIVKINGVVMEPVVLGGSEVKKRKALHAITYTLKSGVFFFVGVYLMGSAEPFINHFDLSHDTMSLIDHVTAMFLTLVENNIERVVPLFTLGRQLQL